jgi:GNAT superfamily N-acetyltransferase
MSRGSDSGSPYVIQLATRDHVASLNAIELAAARLLVGYAPESVLRETTNERDLLAAIASGLLWVASDGSRVVGFAQVKILEPAHAHLDELDVHPDHGRRGVGRRLVQTICDWAGRAGFGAVTLSTFKSPPWNAPFYTSMGFRALRDEELSPPLRRIVDHERERGLDVAQRVVMLREVAAPT